MRPLLGVPAVIGNGRSIFYVADEKVTIEAPEQLMQSIAELCDGSKTIEQIVHELEPRWAHKPLIGLLEELHRRLLLVDYRFFAESAWRMAENPSSLLPELTEDEVDTIRGRAQARHSVNPPQRLFGVTSSTLKNLIVQRQSVRNFSGKSATHQQIVDMAWSAYGATSDNRRAVPSAGALYPLTVHVAILQDSEKLARGVYEVFLGSEDAVGFTPVSDDVFKFLRAFADPFMTEKAAGAFVISGSFRVSGEKYGNRGMLYVPLEAGHSAQNVHLAATELGVSCVEIGGFAESLLSDALCLPEGHQPLTTILFGSEPESVPSESLKTHWVTPIAGEYRPPFTIALARVDEVLTEDWSYGRDKSPLMARTKAHSEAREWAACGSAPDTLVRARLCDLDYAVNPRSIVSFHPSQYRVQGFPFTRFCEEGKYLWAEGREELSGKPVHVLADLVYFTVNTEMPPYAYANSSGVAAHPDRHQAVETATLELVERDAFMCAYFASLTLPTISNDSVPNEIRRRIADLEKVGFKIWIKDHTLDLAPVISIFAQSDDLAFTTCASCSRFSPFMALEHALMEVEAAVLARLQNGASAHVNPKDVAMPLDHGALYEQRRFFLKADFMFRTGETTSLARACLGAARNWSALLDRFSSKAWVLFTVPLELPDSYGGNQGLSIIRSLVPGMVPMTFGYRQEPAGMKRLHEIKTELGQGELNYRDLPRFPHPFA